MECRLLKSNRSNRRSVNKKGILMGTVIFILLNLAFFALLIVYVKSSASGIGMQQRVLAKEIALFINSAVSNTTIEINLASYKETAEKNGVKEEDLLRINKTGVTATLSKTQKGFTYPCYSAYGLEKSWLGNLLVIEVKDA